MQEGSKYYQKEITGEEFNHYLQSDETKYGEKMFIKFFEKDDCSRGFRYKTGLNIDVNQFNPTGNCQGGGLYFTDLHNFYSWCIFGKMVAIVTIPNDARVYCEDGKAKADKISISERMIFPQFFKTIKKEMWIELIKKNDMMLQYVPIDLKTAELCEIAVKTNGFILNFVPIKLRTFQLCVIAVKNNGFALSYVPKELITRELCEVAIKQNKHALESLPNELKTAKLCEITEKQIM